MPKYLVQGNYVGEGLKGLLKDAAFDLLDAKIINEEFITEIFGKAADDITKEPSVKGTASFSYNFE